jgi:predicted ATPase/DNA-binding CsgD family transcriptional regulator/transcriptional regulator with XRE-family HTH domain
MATEEPAAFGVVLRRNRLAAGLTQEALAELAGMSARGIADLERGARRWPYPATVRRLAGALGLGKAELTQLQTAARPASPVAGPTQQGVTEAVEANRHNLPGPRTRLIGRDHDRAAVGRVLLEAEGRLVTLTGVGGCGKTRLALAVAAELVDAFSDGVWLVELASLTDPTLIPQSVAKALGVREEPTRPILDTVLASLKSRQLLLVLDNCEHLVEACAAFVDRVLGDCPNVRLLATSREQLRIHDEITWPVPSLGVPHMQQIPSLDEIARSPAVQLFVERAQALQPAFVLTAQNASITGHICRRLDGLPLGIELAAAWLRALGVEEIVERLDASVRLLVGGSRTAPDRQQTLRATLDWSHGLLTHREQVVFRQLAVFVGGWSLEAAEAVCRADDIQGAEVLELIGRLVDKSLVVMAERDGRARYNLLEPVHQYAWERLLETGAESVADVRQRHLAWYLGLAQHSDPDLAGSAQHPGLTQLQTEHDNLRAALAWSLERGPEQAVRLAACLADFWRHGGHHAEGRRWLNAVLGTMVAPGANAEAHARVLLGLGVLAADGGEFGAGQVSLAKESVKLFRDVADQHGLNVALLHLGRCLLESGAAAEQIRPAFDEGLRVAQALDDQRQIGAALANLAYLAWWQGDRRTAVELYADAVVHVRASGDAMFTGLFLSTLGWYTLVEGDVASARRYKEEGLALLRGLGAREAVGLALLGLAHVARQERNDPRLLALLEESASLLIEAGSPGLVDWLSFLGQVHVERGAYAEGVRLLAAGDSDGPRFGSQRALLYLMPRDEFEASLAAAQSVLGESAFDEAWSEGKASTPDQAASVALARSGIIPTAPSQGRSDGGAASPLTPRQYEVAVLVAQGLTNRQIAKRLLITPRAAAAHVEHILDKLGAGSRTQIGVWIAERGLLTTRTA